MHSAEQNMPTWQRSRQLWVHMMGLSMGPGGIHSSRQCSEEPVQALRHKVLQCLLPRLPRLLIRLFIGPSNCRLPDRSGQVFVCSHISPCKAGLHARGIEDVVSSPGAPLWIRGLVGQSRRIVGADTLEIDRTTLKCSMYWGAIAHL